MNPLTPSQWLEFLFTKFVHIAIRFIIPSLYIPLFDMVCYMYNLAGHSGNASGCSVKLISFTDNKFESIFFFL